MEGLQIYKWTWHGLLLQEPSVFITDILLAFFCFFVFFKVKGFSPFEKNWRMFYLTLGLCTFLGGFGHLLFHYFGVPGKYVGWIFSIISNYFAASAIISELESTAHQKSFQKICISKSIILLLLALVSQKFVFIAIDAVFSYLYFTAFLSYKINKPWSKWMIYGFFIILPSVFFLILKFDPHIHFNRIDVGHFFMILAISSFWKGIIEYKQHNTLA